MSKLSFKERRRERRRFLLQRWVIPLLSRPLILGSGPILVVAPHQDDETLACGGMIAQQRRAGQSVAVAFLTDGSRSHEGRTGAPSREELTALRRDEAQAALSILGVDRNDIYFLDFPDGQLSALSSVAQTALCAQLVDLIVKYKPTAIFVPHCRDTHPDHEAAFRAAKAAESAAGRSDVPDSGRIYQYPVWLYMRRSRLFRTLSWRDLSGARLLKTDREIEGLKRRAMAEYRSQLEQLPPGFVERALSCPEVYFL